MSYIADCLTKFKNLPDEIREAVGGLESLNKIKALENKYGIDLKFLVVLVAIGELRISDISEYIKNKYGVDTETGAEVKKGLLSDIFSQLATDIQSQTELTPEDIRRIFENGLVKIFSGDGESIKAINENIIYLLSIDEGIRQEDLEKLLLNNREKITNKKFILNRKSDTPSAGNWISDFIKRHGTNMFNNVTLTEYTTNSENAKLLDKQERSAVVKLLMLYRNLKFFPDSMADLPPEDWEIIPIEKTGDERSKARKVSGPPRTEEEKEIDELKQEEERYKPGGLERLALEEEIGEKLQADKLRALATRYKEGSLERKAIEEEIRRLGS